MRISDWSSDVCSSDLIKIILLTPSPDLRVNLTEPGNELEVFSKMIRNLAENYHIGLADAFGQFRKHALAVEDLKDFMSHVNHPNLKGHQLIANEIVHYFKIGRAHV